MHQIKLPLHTNSVKINTQSHIAGMELRLAGIIRKLMQQHHSKYCTYIILLIHISSTLQQ